MSKALILCGGLGTRLKETVSDLPKSMAPVAGRPFLEYQIKFLKAQGITDIILCVSHMSEKIKSYFGSGIRLGVDITYSEEQTPLGTAGAIKNAENYLDDTFIVLNGDSYSQINILDLIEFHKMKRALCTLSLAESLEAQFYGSAVMDGNKIVGFSEKSTNPKAELVSRGIYVMEPAMLDHIPKDKKSSLENEIFPSLVEKSMLNGILLKGYFADIGRPESYKAFKEKVLTTLALGQNNTIKDALKIIHGGEINLIMILDNERKLAGVLTDRIIKSFLLSGGNMADPVSRAMRFPSRIAKSTDSKDSINEILLSGVNSLPILDELGRVVDVQFRQESFEDIKFPVLRGKAPLRISFSGGGTDIPYFFEKYGGSVISVTINKYCYATIVKRADKKIIIDSDLTSRKDVVVSSIKDITYDGNFDIIKAIIKILKPNFGFELYIHNDIPPGRGLGSSASLSSLVIRMLSNLMSRNYTDYEIAELAYKVEREELGIKGGWQDQYATVTGGFNFMDFSKEKTIIYPLRLKEHVINELDSRLLLCYVGKSHNSGEVHESQEKSFTENEEEKSKSLQNIKEIAIKMRDSLLMDKLEDFGELLHTSWEIKNSLSDKISNSRINELYNIGIKNGAQGGKLLGAGNGGYILFFYDPKMRNKLKKSLEECGAEITDFSFEFEGIKIWESKV
ncbi:MAG: sugar phosphate nucleotidyltransferase [Nanoarchaeota archaeon]